MALKGEEEEEEEKRAYQVPTGRVVGLGHLVDAGQDHENLGSHCEGLCGCFVLYKVEAKEVGYMAKKVLGINNIEEEMDETSSVRGPWYLYPRRVAPAGTELPHNRMASRPGSRDKLRRLAVGLPALPSSHPLFCVRHSPLARNSNTRQRIAGLVRLASSSS
jgi:hypothetical protein